MLLRRGGEFRDRSVLPFPVVEEGEAGTGVGTAGQSSLATRLRGILPSL